MAERRMFSKTIINSDLFLDLPSSAQNLYFHLSLNADDEGFVNSPKDYEICESSNRRYGATSRKWIYKEI